ncbi:NPC intracellular cholesterol transporter 2-like [Betta splendens]|uniref:NPC intracellular cholesterol transporter 2 n=1 Tax=Betta splendens TaxID=158456 RepID=A0A6P7LM50_BETSP|nr:NPC intracellular cholesterol transporter 2-like [Betta splendens]
MDTRAGFVVLLCLIGFTCVEMTVFKACPSSSGKVVSVDIVPCNTVPCQLHKGESYTVNVTLSSDVDSNGCTAVVHGVIAGIPVPFSIPNSDGCKSGIECPVQKGRNYNYVATLPVKTDYPSISLTVKWELTDDSKEDLFCIMFPVEIVS